jgi:hypothetical protein
MMVDIKIGRGLLAALTAAFAIVAATAGFIALVMWLGHVVTGPLDMTIIRAWLDTTADLLRLPPTALLLAIATIAAFSWGIK